MLRLVSAYDRNLRRLLAALESVHTGLLLGLLRRDALDRMTQQSYRQRALYLDDTYNASGLFDWERQAIAQHFHAGSRLLLAGCGGGRELLALAQEGFRVDAFDPNPDYVALAARTLREQGWPGRALPAPPGALPAELEGVYDGAILGWGMYTHLIGRDARVALLRAFHDRLVGDAPLLLSFWTRGDDSRRNRLQHAVAGIAATCSFNPRRPESGDDLSQQAFVHWFDPAEISGELQDAGFRLASWCAKPYGHAVARRIRPTA